MAELLANSEDPGQMLHFAASDLGVLFANYPFEGLWTKNKNGLIWSWAKK